jgi:thiosulfate/3-mercaptopyruvate sulfurtransferase
MSIHRCSRRIFVLIAALVLMSALTSAKTQLPSTTDLDTTMDTLVTTEWLSQHLDDPDLVVLDCTVRVEMDEEGVRVVNGRAGYESGHIPSAGFADLLEDLSDVGPGKNGLPTPEHFCAAMGALGVGDDSRVVLYDGNHSVWAARVWWMLRWVGFDRAAVLDGGLETWTAEGRPLSTEAADRLAKQLTLHLRPELIADRDEVLAAIGSSSVNLIDAMPEAHYRGEMTMYDRPGHIPGASNVPAFALLDESGRYRPPDELAAMFDGDRNDRAITYCGGGIAASSDAFIMTRLGFTNVAVYAASLREWAADPANPLVVD